MSDYFDRNIEAVEDDSSEEESDESESDDSESDDSGSKDETVEENPARKKQKGIIAAAPGVVTAVLSSKIGTKRTYLTNTERNTVETAFKTKIRLGKVPGKIDVINFHQNPSFSKYPWTKVKFTVYNMICATKRQGVNNVFK